MCLHSYHLARKEEETLQEIEKIHHTNTNEERKCNYTNLNKTDAATITMEILIQVLSGSIRKKGNK